MEDSHLPRAQGNFETNYPILPTRKLRFKEIKGLFKVTLLVGDREGLNSGLVNSLGGSWDIKHAQISVPVSPYFLETCQTRGSQTSVGFRITWGLV